MARGLALLSKAFGARLARLNASQQSELAALLEKLTKQPLYRRSLSMSACMRSLYSSDQ